MNVGYEYWLVISQSFGCINMLNLCICESFEENVSCEPEFDQNVYLVVLGVLTCILWACDM